MQRAGVCPFVCLSHGADSASYSPHAASVRFVLPVRGSSKSHITLVMGKAGFSRWGPGAWAPCPLLNPALVSGPESHRVNYAL